MNIEDDPYINADNQLFDELQGNNMESFSALDSAARKVMGSKFLGQHLNVKGSEPKRFYTGAEFQHGKYDVGVSMPSNGKILKTIRKYESAMSSRGSGENSSTIYIWEGLDDEGGRIIDAFECKAYHDEHLTFGFKFKERFLAVGDSVNGGEKITSTPAISDEGQYCYGAIANLASMGDPATTEDGAVISRSFQKRMATTQVGLRFATWGSYSGYYALNIHGDHDNYKPFLDIGDKIPESGLLMVLRKRSPLLDVVKMSPDALLYDGVDHAGDRPIYGLAGATITDITIIKNTPKHKKVSSPMDEQVDYYYNQHMDMYRNLLSYYYTLKKMRGTNLVVGYELSRMIALALAKTSKDTRKKDSKINSCKYTYNGQPLDDLRIEIKYAKETLPQPGYKMSTTHGGKTVVVSIREDEDMPVDANGNIADIIMDDVSVVNRMIMGTPYEQLFNAAVRDAMIPIRKHIDKGEYDIAWKLVDEVYEILSPPMHEVVTNLYKDEKGRIEHLHELYKDGFYIWLPSWSPSINIDTIRKIRERIPICYGPIKYTSVTGKKVITKSPVLIGGVYIMLLDKIGEHWTAVPDAKLQHNGLLSKTSSGDRYLTPGRQSPVRIWGEPETRLLLGALSSEAVVEIHDRANSPEANKMVCKNILSSENPSHIDNAVDRSVLPFGSHRALRYISHVLSCGGTEFINDGKGL